MLEQHAQYATAIPSRNYPFSSDQGSQTGLGSTSTRLSDRPGTLTAVVFMHKPHNILLQLHLPLLGGLALQGGNIQWGQTAGIAALPLAALPFAAGRAFHAHTVCLAPLCNRALMVSGS